MKICKLCNGIVWGKGEGDICSACRSVSINKNFGRVKIVFSGGIDEDE